MYYLILVLCGILMIVSIVNAVRSCIGNCAVCGKKVGMSGQRIIKSKAMVCSDCFKKASNAHKKSSGLILNSMHVTIEEIKSICENGMDGVLVAGKYYENGIFVDREHYKKCNVCGRIFCFRDSDLRKNEQLSKNAKLDNKMAVMEMICGSRIAGNQDIARAENLRTQIIDYSKCPNCSSTNLIDVTENQVKSENKSNNNTVTSVSSADELKKFKDLLDSGVITQEEFDVKKKQLLDL